MPNDKFKNYLHLHLIVLIWGFTAVLGKLISIDAMPLVWYRMVIASILVAVYIIIRRNSIRVSPKTRMIMFMAGIVIALHWVTFFKAIKVSNVSIALVTMSTGALFTRRGLVPHLITRPDGCFGPIPDIQCKYFL